MLHLDEKTLQALADLICGDGGPFYRKGYELPVFFRSAGLSCPNHDGSTRKWWTLDRLREYNDDLFEPNMDKIILRLAEPKEYTGHTGVVHEVLKKLNEILSVEGVKVVIEGVIPKIKEIKPSLPESEPTKKQFAIAIPDFARITNDPSLTPYLEGRWKEVIICVEAEAHLAAIILMGSILEGVLLAVVHANPQQANTANSAPKDRSGNVRRFGEWTLSNLIDVSHECGWIQLDARRFSHVLREYRNLVHPWEQRARNEVPDEDTCKICWEVVNAAIRDIKNFMGI